MLICKDILYWHLFLHHFPSMSLKMAFKAHDFYDFSVYFYDNVKRREINKDDKLSVRKELLIKVHLIN